MITKSSILISYKNKEVLREKIANLLGATDVDFTIMEYDYFDVNEYKKRIEASSISPDENSKYIEILSNVFFIYEVDFGTSATSVESNYFPAYIDFISQVLSLQLQCDVLTSFKPLSGDEYCPVTYFSNGKEIVNFISDSSNFWAGVLWVKRQLHNS
ncbi:hypothetical protein HF650_22615 [Kosakonia sp. SMBL-WEM22]|uniref:hypothetical protein n=1 Tax=Kosakonia sp. SMBL-WEM22 TaxID=2725560 RepID=UPI001659CE38|nr:hypothetical protein [Kosakonia sp. SMBL-WEM22]QNQ22314.1 hypothetical protein HF650_22615 [Kosakonia sp. SMBL-WEM22]